MSTEERKCLKCGGLMEDGFLWSNNSVGDHCITSVERCGWMAGADFQNEEVGIWPLKISVTANQRRELTASRCTSCGLVEFYAR
jgi:predicted nucleic-acid-binding Zn-ribbon protein